MTIKISQLPSTGTLADTNLFPLVANVSGTLTSQQATLAVLKNYVLAGNATTATRLVTARAINGVVFDGTQDITVTVPLSPATTSTIGGVIIPVVGTSGITNSSGTIGLATATTTQLGGVKVDGTSVNINGSGVISVATINVATTSVAGTVIVGNGLQVTANGTLSTAVTPAFHGFVVKANGDLEYTKMTSGDLAVANGNGTEQYVMWEIGTSNYSWKIASDGLLEIEYTDSDI